MLKVTKPFNEKSLLPFNNPKECEKLFFEQENFYPYVFSLKWNYLDIENYISNIDFINKPKIFFKCAYLIYIINGSEQAYEFIKRYGKFNSILYRDFYNIDFFIFLLKVFDESGTNEDIIFIFNEMKHLLPYTLPKSVSEPDIYTHASLHAYITSVIHKRNLLTLDYAHSNDVIIFDILNEKLVLKSALGNEIKVLNARKKLKIASMMRIRNEGENIEFLIESICKFVDVIIIYDDFSQDNTIEVIKKCQQNGYNIHLIEGTEWLFNEALIHQIIVEEGRTLGVTHFIQIDGDEVLSSNFTPKTFRELMEQMEPGDILAVPWLNLTENLDSYYADDLLIGSSPSRGLKRYKDIAFADDGFSQFSEWSYSHVNVAPFTYKRRFISLTDELSLLHLEQINLINFAAKKDWYRIRAFAQNKKMPVDPYLDIRLDLLQLHTSIRKLTRKQDINPKLIEIFSKLSIKRIESNIEGIEKYPETENHMYIKYSQLSNKNNNNISEK